MRGKFAGLVLLLIGSVAIGLILGSVFFGLFDRTVPPAVLTSFNKGTAHAAFIVYGVVAGVAIFVWGLVVLALSRFFRH